MASAQQPSVESEHDPTAQGPHYPEPRPSGNQALDALAPTTLLAEPPIDEAAPQDLSDHSFPDTAPIPPEVVPSSVAEAPESVPPPPLPDLNGFDDALTEAMAAAVAGEMAPLQKEIGELTARVGQLENSLQNRQVGTPSTLFGAISLTAFSIACYNFWRARAKAADDWGDRRRDIGELLQKPGRFIFEDPKTFLILDVPSRTGEGKILMVDDPRQGTSLDAKKVLGPYVVELISKAAKLAAEKKDPFVLDYVDQVKPSFRWILDAIGRFDFQDAALLPYVKKDPRKHIKLKLEILVENAFPKGVRKVLEGGDQLPNYLLVTLVCDHKPNGSHVIKTYIFSEEMLAKLGDPKQVERMLKDNPGKIREIHLAQKLWEREMKEREANAKRPPTGPQYPEGHIRHYEPRGYLVPVMVYLDPAPKSRRVKT